MTMTKREKILITVVLVLALVAVYFLFFLKPNMDALRSLNNDITDKESLSFSVSQQQQIIKSLDKAIEENEARITVLSNGISTGFDQPAVLVYLQNTVNEYARKLTFTFGDMQQTGQLYMCPVSISMLCRFDGLKSVMAAFNDSPYFIKVVAVTVTKPEQQIIATAGEGEPAETPAISSPVAANGEMSATLDIELYGRPGVLETGAVYEFAEGYQYGGDIFN